MPNVGVLLSGCGVNDGTEINEAVLSIYFLEKHGADLIFMALDKKQMHVIDHLTGQIAKNETRNVMVESARITRGNIRNVKDISINDIDALFIPGGFGAAKNLSTFAIDSTDYKLDPAVENIILAIIMAKKPLAAICIAPVLIAKALQKIGIKSKITIGNDKDTAEAIQNLGAVHINCPVDEAIVDKENKIVTSPAYMLGNKVFEVAKGIEETAIKLMGLL